MSENFKRALAYVFANEGGYSNHPDDAGGPTNFGITQGTLAQWRGEPVSAEDVQNLTANQAAMIYAEHYWKPLACEKMLRATVATAVFDAGVLFGISAAATCAQKAARACGFPELAVDGHIGAFTLNAVNASAPADFVKAFHYMLTQRVERIVETHPKYIVFRKGWVSRVDKLLTLNQSTGA